MNIYTAKHRMKLNNEGNDEKLNSPIWYEKVCFSGLKKDTHNYLRLPELKPGCCNMLQIWDEKIYENSESNRLRFTHLIQINFQ